MEGQPLGRLALAELGRGVGQLLRGLLEPLGGDGPLGLQRRQPVRRRAKASQPQLAVQQGLQRQRRILPFAQQRRLGGIEGGHAQGCGPRGNPGRTFDHRLREEEGLLHIAGMGARLQRPAEAAPQLQIEPGAPRAARLQLAEPGVEPQRRSLRAGKTCGKSS